MDGSPEDKILARNTFYSHFASLVSLVILFIILVIILIFFRFDQGILKIFVIGYLIDAIPALYLHLEYWLTDKGEAYHITDCGITQYKKNQRCEYRSEDIEKIVIYKSASMDKGGIPILAIESYFFAKVKLKSGEELTLTCLLSPKIDKQLRRIRGVLFERKKKAFCMIN